MRKRIRVEMLEGNSGAEYLEKLRHAEPVRVRKYFQPRSRVVELYVEIARRLWLPHATRSSGGHAPLNASGGARGMIKRALPLAPHGVYPSAASELYYFSRRRWLRVFRTADYQVLAAIPAGVFYTGYEVLPGLSMHARKRLAKLLGSSCMVFVLWPACH